MTSWIHRVPVGTKLTLLGVVSTCVALVVAGLGFLYLDYRSMQTALMDQIELQAQLSVRQLQAAVEFEDEPLAEDSLLLLAEVPGVAGAEILFSDGRRLAGVGEMPSEHNGFRVVEHPIPLRNGRSGMLAIAARPSVDRARMLRNVEILVAILVVAMLVAYLLARRLRSMIALPIEELTRLMRNVSQNRDYTVRAEINARDEVGELIQIFNEMITQIEWGELELRDAKDSLEENVDERTRALQDEVDRRRDVESKLIEARDEAERLGTAKAEFLANMSHEIRTPLIGVIGMAELLQDTELDDMQRQYVETLVGSSSHLLALVNDILDISRLNRGGMTLELVDFDLADLSYEVVSLLYPQARDKGIEIAVGYPTKVPRQLKGDPARLRQILTNLLSNAVKFTSEGSIALRFELLERLGNGYRLRIEVEDTGVGIAHDQLEKIFDQFEQGDTSTTRKFGGTGLGLAIAKNLTELMEGSIHVDSTMGEGTCFRLDIPFGEAQRQRRLPWPKSDWKGMRSLLAMEDGFPAQTLQRKLEEFGLAVQRIERPGSRLFHDQVRELATAAEGVSVVVADSGAEPERTLEILRGLSADLGASSPWFVLLADPAQIRGDEHLHHMVGGSVLRKPARHSDIVRILDLASHEEGMPVLEHDRPKVLFAEDNVVNQRICGAMLERCGFDVQCVSDGEQAVAVMAEGYFDLVLMDAHMPKMDGLRATRAIREAEGEGAQSLIIGLLSSERAALEDACHRAGMNEILSKPLTMAKLETLCERHFPLVAPA